MSVHIICAIPALYHFTSSEYLHELTHQDDIKQARTQIQAHDQEVFDVTFGHSRHTFVSSSADGSVRLFDLRALEHSTVVYESPELVPLPRVAWNGCDANYIATFGARSCSAFIIDVRKSQNAVAELKV